MRYSVNLNGEQYRFDSFGYGEPLVMLHGFTGSAQTWRNQIPAFSQHFEVITPDLLGHGETSAPKMPERYRIEHAAADLINMFDALRLMKVNLVGYSMGGRLALYTAAHYPHRIKSLVLESASPGIREEAEQARRREEDERLAGRLEKDGLQAFIEYWEQLPLWDTQKHTMSDEARQILRAERMSHQASGLINSLRGMGTGIQRSLWGRLPDLLIPVQLLVGELDAKFVHINQEMATLLPDMRLARIAGVGHAVHLEKPSTFEEVVLGFLNNR